MLKIHQGIGLIPIRLFFLLSMISLSLRQYDKHRSRVSQLTDFFAVKRIKYDMLQLKKVVQWGKHFYFSIETPRWPSGAWQTVVKNGGLNLTAQGTSKNRHINLAILAITSRCDYRCAHCYEQHNVNTGTPVPLEIWKKTVHEIQQHGAGIIAISGGEPMLSFDTVLRLLESADKKSSEFHLYTSGYGVNDQTVSQLKSAGLAAAAIGLDDADPQRFDHLRGKKGAYDSAVSAVECFQRQGIFTYINTCLTKDVVQNRGLWRLLDAAKKMDIGIIRLLEPKPCGGYLHRNPQDLFSNDDRATATRFFLEANNSPTYFRHPLVSYVAYTESPEHLGCGMGGLSHFHIDSSGNVNPCVFIPVSFGNILRGDFGKIYQKMRSAVPFNLRTTCPSVQLADDIRKAKSRGESLPIPFEQISNKWEKMFSQGV